jgi:hypothetical protein
LHTRADVEDAPPAEAVTTAQSRYQMESPLQLGRAVRQYSDPALGPPSRTAQISRQSRF